MNIDAITDAFSRRFRRKRMARACRALGIGPETSVLDVGGTLFNWRLLDFLPRLTLVNLEPQPGPLPPGVRFVRADGCRLPFADASFDVCFSNSVIEHVGTWENQVRFAEETRRVARSYYVQTPNYWFWIEPHLVAPFIHWLPLRWQRRLIRHFTLFGLLERPSPEVCEIHLRTTRLLRRRELAALFGGGELEAEQLLGLSKSFIAHGKSRAEAVE
jgi:hypothetical protein